MHRITSIGELLFDVYPEGKKPGGAPFNFIYHIRKITGQGNFISRIGTDEYGREMIGFLRKNRIPLKFIQIDEMHPTGFAKPVLNENKVPYWFIAENSAYDFIKADESIMNLINKDTDCLYFGTLAQRHVISRSTIRILFNKPVKYFCDLNLRQNFYNDEILDSSLKAADILKLNEDEFQIISERLLNPADDTDRIAESLLQAYKIELLCITKGEKGSVIYTKTEKNETFQELEKPVDTVGAGDAFAAVLCLGYLKGLKISDINELASGFAAEIVQINGALPADDKIYNSIKKDFADAS
ncbi:MAG: carbohydrate kinase [Ignavibacteriaceae bacterium]